MQKMKHEVKSKKKKRDQPYPHQPAPTPTHVHVHSTLLTLHTLHAEGTEVLFQECEGTQSRESN